MDLEREQDNNQKIVLEPDMVSDILFENVSFRYGSRKDVFNGLNLKILIFDEATSSLDSISERYVKQTLNALAQRRKTIIVIAHQLSTVKNADTIVVIDQGKVMETGSHSALFRKE